MTPTLEFHITPARSRELIMGTLTIRGLGPAAIQYDATSGIAGYQKRGDIWVRGKGLIPPSSAIIEKYTVETTPTRPTNRVAAGEWQYRILPDEVWSNWPAVGGEPARRTLLRIHFDANHATSPGSAGCIVLTDQEQWGSFMDHMLEASAMVSGGAIPLEVIHA